MSFAELIRDATVSGPPARLDLAAATRLGRAFGTALRRRTVGGTQRVLVARAGNGPELALRDGLVRGLLMAGHALLDLGAVEPAPFERALAELGAAGAVLAACEGPERCALSFWLGKRPLAGEALVELAALADGDDFAAGEGSLALVDLPTALRAARAGAAP